MKKEHRYDGELDGDKLFTILQRLTDGVYDFHDKYGSYTVLVVVDHEGYKVSHGYDKTCTRRSDCEEVQLTSAPTLVQEYAAFLSAAEDTHRGNLGGEAFGM